MTGREWTSVQNAFRMRSSAAEVDIPSHDNASSYTASIQLSCCFRHSAEIDGDRNEQKSNLSLIITHENGGIPADFACHGKQTVAVK